MFKSFRKVTSDLIQGLTLTTLATMLIYPNYLKNLILQRLFQESTHTGIDYLPAFYTKGKVKPLLLMAKETSIRECIQGFSQLRYFRNYHC